MVDTYATIDPNGYVRLSARGTRLILESHTIAARAMLVNEVGVTQELPMVAGSVAADSSSTIRRTAQLTILGRWSDDPNSQLTPYGARVRIERGIRLSRDDVEWVPLITGRITEVAQSSDDKDAALTLTVKDDMFTVAQDRFDVPTSTNTAEDVVVAIRRLLRETLPQATVSDFTGSTVKCGAMDLQRDRAGAVASLARSIGAEVFTTRDGSGFIIRPSPTLNDTPRWALTVGEESGSVISVQRSRSGEKTYNRVYAYGESNNTAQNAPPPVSGVAVISDLADPLRYGGPFGKVTRFYKSPLLTTGAQAVTAAQALLEKARGRNYEITFATLVNPAIEPGDVVLSLISDGVRRVHVIDSATLPLAPGDSQSITVRTAELPEEGA